jgi:cytochrome P450
MNPWRATSGHLPEHATTGGRSLMLGPQGRRPAHLPANAAPGAVTPHEHRPELGQLSHLIWGWSRRVKMRIGAGHDGPDHTRLRRLVLRAFSPRVIGVMRPRIQQIVDELVDGVADAGRMEVIKELAFTVPVTVLAGLLGAPASSSPMFRDCADRLLAFQGMNRPAEGLLLAAQDALLEARQYLAELIVERRSEPGTDLISLMACPGDNAESLSYAEIINTGITLLVATRRPPH